MRERMVWRTQAALLGLTALVLWFSLYMQYVQGLQPCPLCYMQRICTAGLLGFGIWACCTRSQLLLGIQWILAVLGGYFAVRQLWLQAQPVPEVAVCLPGLELLLYYLPWRDLAQLFLWGSVACNEIAWQAWGFSMAAWSAGYFAIQGVALAGLLMCLRMSPTTLGLNSDRSV